MFQAERERRILDYLSRSRIASPVEIQAVTETSIATVRRDLCEMEKKGLVSRAHGYVQLPESSLTFADPPMLEEKERIAEAAAKQIHDGDSIFLGSGTTCTCLARHLKGKRDLMIMTINLDVVYDLLQLSNVKLTLLGGEVRVENGYVETLDEYTLQTLTRFYFDKVFLTVDGIDFEYGYSIRHRLQLSLFQHLLHNSKEFYCLADATKFNRRAYVQFCPINAIGQVVTTSDVSDQYSEEFARHGIQIICG